MSQRQFIPLNDDDDSFDEDTEFDLSKMTAMDYLRRVRFERKHLPEVVTILIGRSDCVADTQDNDESVANEYHPQNPTKEFGELQRRKFEEMQTKIQRMRNDPNMILKLPDCSGAQELDTTDADVVTFNSSTTVAFCELNDPKLSICLHLSQKQLEDILEVLSSHFQMRIDCDSEFYQQLPNICWITKWVYATLACLHFPLEGHCLHNLRSIARICIEVRNSLKSRSESTCESVLPFNLIVCLVALNFRQLDLLNF